MNPLEDNVVLVGNKPVSVYAFAIQTIFDKEIKEVKVMSRGNSILKAINIVEYMKRNEQLEIKEIKSSSSEYESKFKEDAGKMIFISTLEITVTKK